MIRLAIVEDEAAYVDCITEYLQRYEEEKNVEIQICG